MSNQAYAFFDVDGTLIRIKSMFSFHDYWYRHWLQLIGRPADQEGEDISAILRTLERSGAPREFINRRYYEFFGGRDVAQIAQCAVAWFDHVKHTPALFIEESVNELERLRTQGIEPVLVSGSFMEILSPIANVLDVKHIMGTRLVANGSRYTGKILPPQTIGAGKAQAVRQFLSAQDCDATACWAFGDDVSDLPMLQCVGNGVAIGGNTEMEALAASHGLRVISTQRSVRHAATLA